jgi:putative membrane protein
MLSGSLSARRDSAAPRSVLAGIGVLSLAVAAFLIWLIYFKGRAIAPEWVASLPAANAAFNSLSALCLLAGYLRIRRKDRVTHRRFMLAATFFSALFLVSYITYHSFHGDTHFPGQGWVRPAYFALLISHIGLSMVALPLIFATLYFSLSGRFSFHRKVARWTFPIWMYVSVTGVVVFFVLRAYTGA